MTYYIETVKATIYISGTPSILQASQLAGWEVLAWVGAGHRNHFAAGK